MPVCRAGSTRLLVKLLRPKATRAEANCRLIAPGSVVSQFRLLSIDLDHVGTTVTLAPETFFRLVSWGMDA
jgi:hypothetical protein